MQILSITDKARWNERAVPKLAEDFGDTVVRAYVTEPDALQRVLRPGTEKEKATAKKEILGQTLISMGGIDKAFIISENKRRIGFLTIEDQKIEIGKLPPARTAEDDSLATLKAKKTSILRDIVVKEGDRRKGFGKRLYESAFRNGDFDYLIGYTRTPGAVKLRIETGKECGFEGYCGLMGLRGTDKIGPDSNIEIELLHARTAAYLEKEGLLDEETKNLPSGFVAIKRDSDESAVFPIDRIDVSALPHGPIREQFETLNKLQQEIIERTKREHPEKLPPSVALTLSSVKKPEKKRPTWASPLPNSIT